MNERVPPAPAGFYHAHTHTHTGEGTRGNNARFRTPYSSSSSRFSFCCSLKRKLKSALWSPARATAIAPLHRSLRRKVLPNRPTQAASPGPSARLCGSRGGSGPRGRQGTRAGSPHRCRDFYSLLQSRRGRTPAAWELSGLVHRLSPASRCCSAQERHRLCPLPGIPPPAASMRTASPRRWGLAREEVAIFWLWCEQAMANHALQTQLPASGRLCCKKDPAPHFSSPPPPRPPEFSSF